MRESVLITHRISSPDIRKDAFTEVADYFRQAGIETKGKYWSAGKRVIQKLMKDNTVTYKEFLKIVNDNVMADELLQANVFSYNMRENTVTFQSRLVKAYVTENQSEYLAPSLSTPAIFKLSYI